MARPNSKYFASVITKLIAAKRKENIVIDESFKMQLRSDLLTRAAGPLAETQAPLDIGAFFAKWKYAFAAVPSALVVMLIAVQFLNMPVSIPSEQIVETGSQVEDEVQTIELSEGETVDEELADEGGNPEEVVTSPSTTRKSTLRTFPGSLVMPRNLNDDVEANSFALPNESSEPASSDTPEVAEVESTPSTAQPFNFFGLLPNTQDQVDEDDSDTVGAHREERFTTEDDRSQNGVNDDSVNVEVDDTPTTSEPVQQIGQVVHVGGNEDQGSGGGEMPMGNQVESPVQEDAAPSQQAPVGQVDSSVRLITGGSVEMSEPAAAQALVLAAPTFDYALSLPSYQREVLETIAVPALAGNRTVDHVRVTEKDGDIVAVEVLFEDGGTVVKHYIFNESTQVWDKVSYVTNGGYDNSLTYSTDFVYQLSY